MQVTEKDYLQWTSKPSYMSHKIFDNDLVAIRKSKLTLMLIKPANNGMCILELRKVLMHEFLMITLPTNMAAIEDYFLQKLIILVAI